MAVGGSGGGAGWGIVPLRLVVGLVFVVHGVQKLFGFGLVGTTAFLEQVGVPVAGLAALLLIVVELAGGAALLVGFQARVAAALLAIDMVGAILTVHLRGGFFVPGGVEFVLTLLAACLTLACLGAGAVSVDAARG